MIGYLDFIRDDQGVLVEIGGRSIEVSRARLGLHLVLGKIRDRVREAVTKGDDRLATSLVLEYLHLAGFPIGEADGVDAVVAYTRLVSANRLLISLPFMIEETDPNYTNPPYHYEGRAQAWWVHKLASRYGWSRNDIFALWPEEAACYLQDVIVAEFAEADERRSLTELGYHFDKHTGESRFMPVPRPNWMLGVEREIPVRRIPKSMAPVGKVVNLSGLGVSVESED